jgi:hypothetical protein
VSALEWFRARTCHCFTEAAAVQQELQFFSSGAVHYNLINVKIISSNLALAKFFMQPDNCHTFMHEVEFVNQNYQLKVHFLGNVTQYTIMTCSSFPLIPIQTTLHVGLQSSYTFPRSLAIKPPHDLLRYSHRFTPIRLTTHVPTSNTNHKRHKKKNLKKHKALISLFLYGPGKFPLYAAPYKDVFEGALGLQFKCFFFTGSPIKVFKYVLQTLERSSAL